MTLGATPLAAANLKSQFTNAVSESRLGGTEVLRQLAASAANVQRASEGPALVVVNTVREFFWAVEYDFSDRAVSVLESDKLIAESAQPINDALDYILSGKTDGAEALRICEAIIHTRARLIPTA